jgi:hypothetical protein
LPGSGDSLRASLPEGRAHNIRNRKDKLNFALFLGNFKAAKLKPLSILHFTTIDKFF